MNVYEVVSEALERGGNFHGFDPEPPESFCIAELVVARSPGQAKYAVVKAHDNDLPGFTIADWPKFSIHLVKRNVEGECRIVSEDPDFALCWGEYGRPADQCSKCYRFMSIRSGTAVYRRVSGYFDWPEYEGLCVKCDAEEHQPIVLKRAKTDILSP